MRKKRNKIIIIFIFAILNSSFFGLISYIVSNSTNISATASIITTFISTPTGVAQYLSSTTLTNQSVEQIVKDTLDKELAKIPLSVGQSSESKPPEPKPEAQELTAQPVISPPAKPPTPTTSIPQKPDDAGTVKPATYDGISSSAIYLKLQNGYIKNTTTIDNDSLKNILTQKPDISITNDSSPKVLIFHTHATESFLEHDAGFFDKKETFRSTDNSKNMVAIGEKVVEILEQNGIEVIHDKTHYDYPSYNGAYTRSSKSIEKYKEQYPSLEIILDLHRDAIIIDEDTIIKPVATINDKTAAQIMLISGAHGEGVDIPNYKENIRFASALQNQMEKSYKGLTRPLMFCYRQYNMHQGNGSILVEIGGHANTFEEALYSGELFANSLCKIIAGLKVDQ